MTVEPRITLITLGVADPPPIPSLFSVNQRRINIAWSPGNGIRGQSAFASVIIQSDAGFWLRSFLTRRINGTGNQVTAEERKTL